MISTITLHIILSGPHMTGPATVIIGTGVRPAMTDHHMTGAVAMIIAGLLLIEITTMTAVGRHMTGAVISIIESEVQVIRSGPHKIKLGIRIAGVGLQVSWRSPLIIQGHWSQIGEVE